jgi:hypothetical protein
MGAMAPRRVGEGLGVTIVAADGASTAGGDASGRVADLIQYAVG